jgi:ABC-type uncharacterized transport system permease subunit
MKKIFLKLLAVAVCFLIYMGWIVFLATQGMNPATLGGALPALILIWLLRNVWKRITAMGED